MDVIRFRIDQCGATARASHGMQFDDLRGAQTLLTDTLATFTGLGFLGFLRSRLERAVGRRRLVGIGGVLVEPGLERFNLHLELAILHGQVMDIAQHRPWGVHDHVTGDEFGMCHAVIHLERISILCKMSRGGVSAYEFAIQKGHRYATVIVEPYSKRVLWVGRGLSRDSIRPFFELLGPGGCQAIKAVAIWT